MAEKILLIDDDDELCALVADYLSVEGFAVTCAHDGADGVEKILSGAFALAILDVMLPKLNGFEVLRRVRKTSNLPILMLTARGDEMEKVVGLESGADDYLAKPFNPRELAARLRAILRRTQIAETKIEEVKNETITVDDVEISAAARTVRRGGEIVELTALEFDLLIELVKNAGKVVERESLSKQILGRKLAPFDRSLDMHVSNLRKKLGARKDETERIKTIRSVGYIYTIQN